MAIAKRKAIPLGRDGFAWHNPSRSCFFQELVPEGQPMVNDFSGAVFREPFIPPATESAQSRYMHNIAVTTGLVRGEAKTSHYNNKGCGRNLLLQKNS
jgi:hypothetical protein